MVFTWWILAFCTVIAMQDEFVCMVSIWFQYLFDVIVVRFCVSSFVYAEVKKTHSTKKASNHHANLPLEMYSFTL